MQSDQQFPPVAFVDVKRYIVSTFLDIALYCMDPFIEYAGELHIIPLRRAKHLQDTTHTLPHQNLYYICTWEKKRLNNLDQNTTKHTTTKTSRGLQPQAAPSHQPLIGSY
uniref:Uncharacterized protein n=1 Tax=Setaria viridis TaxID=4556 RepID=A0A4V6DBG2_SETVI|nr:hypothetical protein SEVIR_2G215200v2 [Setaria viridis]